MTLTFDHVTWTSIGNIHSQREYTVPSLAIFKLTGQKILSRSFSKTSSLILTFKQVTSESIGVIYSPEAFTVPSLATLKQMGQEILNRKHFSRRPAVWPLTICMWPQNLGASIVPRLTTLKQRNQRILSGHRLVRPTDRLTHRCKAICPFFSKGSMKMRSYEEHAGIAFFRWRREYFVKLCRLISGLNFKPI